MNTLKKTIAIFIFQKRSFYTELRELIFALVIGAAGSGGLSLMISMAIVVVKLPKAKYSALVTAADLASSMYIILL